MLSLFNIVLFQVYRERIKPLVRDTVTYMNKALQNADKTILVEGANATMLDIDFGMFLAENVYSSPFEF